MSFLAVSRRSLPSIFYRRAVVYNISSATPNLRVIGNQFVRSAMSQSGKDGTFKAEFPKQEQSQPG
jgi:hypothetical protein